MNTVLWLDEPEVAVTVTEFVPEGVRFDELEPLHEVSHSAPTARRTTGKIRGNSNRR